MNGYTLLRGKGDGSQVYAKISDWTINRNQISGVLLESEEVYLISDLTNDSSQLIARLLKVCYNDILKTINQNTCTLSNVYISFKSTNSQILLKMVIDRMNENRASLILVYIYFSLAASHHLSSLSQRGCVLSTVIGIHLCIASHH